MRRHSLANRILGKTDAIALAASLAVVLFVGGIGMLVWDLLPLSPSTTATDPQYSPTLGDRVQKLSTHVRVSISIFAAALLSVLGVLYAIHRQLKEIDNDAGVLFSSHDEFFDSLAEALAVCTTCSSSAIRRRGSLPGEAAKRYYDKHSEWLKADSRRQAVRLVPAINKEESSKDDKTMNEWLERMQTLSEETGRLAMFRIPWDHSHPIINMAILDREKVYLAFLPASGDTASGKWFRIDSASLAEFLLDGYFKALREKH